jgi:hypothetical protein
MHACMCVYMCVFVFMGLLVIMKCENLLSLVIVVFLNEIKF